MPDPFLSGDAVEIEFRVNLKEGVKSESRRDQLESQRDYIAHQLEANLCKTCLNSRLRTGDQASLLMRLEQVLEKIEALPDPDEEVSEYERLMERFSGKLGGPGSKDPVDSGELGTKRGVRRQGGRRPRQNGGTET